MRLIVLFLLLSLTGCGPSTLQQRNDRLEDELTKVEAKLKKSESDKRAAIKIAHELYEPSNEVHAFPGRTRQYTNHGVINHIAGARAELTCIDANNAKLDVDIGPTTDFRITARYRSETLIEVVFSDDGTGEKNTYLLTRENSADQFQWSFDKSSQLASEDGIAKIQELILQGYHDFQLLRQSKEK